MSTNHTPQVHAEPLVNRVVAEQQRRANERWVRIDRAWNIFKYYRKSQLARRGISLIGNRLGLGSRSRSSSQLASATFDTRIQPTAQERFAKTRIIRSESSLRLSSDIRSQLADGEITLLNRRLPLRWRIHEGNGDRAEQLTSLLWQFQLHYHEYLLPLAGESPTREDLNCIEQTIESWLLQNKIDDHQSHQDAWHPYCISRRIPVWLCLLTLKDLDCGLRDRMLESAQLQTEFLSRNLEWDLRGNHLLENLRALSLASLYFDSDQSRQWRSQVHRLIPAEIDEQILEHGEHFERCPMYHCQILGNFLETLIASDYVDPVLSEMIRPVCESMFGFLVDILHPDGEIPLLGDSCFGEAPSVRCLERLAKSVAIDSPVSEKPRELKATRTGKYWISRERNNYLIFDRAAAGADTLPAHAHCDLLTLESSLEGTRWLVDSGLYGYDDDAMRAYCRSSLAHNTVSVNDQNQFDIWSKFRMGSRGETSDFHDGAEGSFQWACASHNAYRRLGIDKISRLVGVNSNEFWYCLDRVQPTNGKQNRLSGFLHLAPEVEVVSDHDCHYRLLVGGKAFLLSFFGIETAKTLSSWYCPEFGVRVPNKVIEYSFNSTGQIAGWLLTFGSTSSELDESELPCLHASRVDLADQITVSSPPTGVVHTFNWKLNL